MRTSFELTVGCEGGGRRRPSNVDNFSASAPPQTDSSRILRTRVHAKGKVVICIGSAFFYLGGEDAAGVPLSALLAARLSLYHDALDPLVVAEVARGPWAPCPCAWLVQGIGL